jgi:uncharacterized protein (TIGR03086 family)
MSEQTERFERLASAFTDRVEAVPPDRWDSPAPCEGWVARDIVRHLVEWIPGFFETYAGRSIAVAASVDDDPVAAWRSVHDQLTAWLDDPTVASEEIDSPPGRMSLEAVVDMIVTGDLLIHTWDLARATGLDERLDAGEVHRMYEAMQPMDEMLRQSGQFGPKVELPDDADEQAKLLAFTGRQPLTPV